MAREAVTPWRLDGSHGVAALSECVDELFVAGPEAWADGVSIEVLQCQLARLEAFVTAATASFDSSGEWSVTGARNAPAWLRGRYHLASGQARRQTRLGRNLRHLTGNRTSVAGRIDHGQPRRDPHLGPPAGHGGSLRSR
jgi:hypothetical protein